MQDLHTAEQARGSREVEECQIFLHLEDVVAMSDADADGLFEKNVTFHVKPGATPDRITMYFDNHTEEEFEAQYLYTDYKTCAIVTGPYEGERCLLLVSKDMAEDVPDSCLANFADMCGVSDNLYSKELCPDDE
ncbi:uncharacterized protein [Dermacentor albipictus]|uniref:uncharacterized protein isoform X3 n=1 Tax=Dermacentor albipictus TaxID=60249 RepID=UPI0031FD8772